MDAQSGMIKWQLAKLNDPRPTDLRKRKSLYKIIRYYKIIQVIYLHFQSFFGPQDFVFLNLR